MGICASADKCLETFVAGVDHDTAFHRVKGQEIKCGYGLQGVCCRLCANGPCRITPDGPKGICGATADTIVARNLLRAVAAGAGCYLHVVETTATKLKEYGMKKRPFKGEATLIQLADLFGVTGSDLHEKAVKVAQKVLDDLYKPRNEEMELTEKMAYTPRFELWKELNILPGGAKSEVFDAVVKSSTNLNSDPVDMLMNCLSLGISTGLYGLTLTNLLNDVMLGEPVIRQASVGFNVIDTDYINIMATGHQHSLISHLQDYLISAEAKEAAREVGAKGFKLVGCTCVGQDLQLRGEHYQEVFSGHAGNNFTSEALLSTGAIDMVVSEFNCTIPGLEPIADALKIKMFCIDDVAKKANAPMIDSLSDEALSLRLVEEAVSAYKERRGHVSINTLPDHGHKDVITGVSEKSLKAFLGNSWQPLIDLIASGQIKGVAGVVGCSSMTAGGHDVFTVGLTKELIKRNILVLSAGCSSGGIENVGLASPQAANLAGENLKAVCQQLGIPPVLNFGPCLAIGRLEIVASELAEALGIDIPQLPLILSAPQWLEEQALADGVFGLALGLPLHLALPPFIDGGPLVKEVLTDKLTGITGGQLIIDDNIKSAADTLESIIQKRRVELKLEEAV